MVLMPGPIAGCIDRLREERPYDEIIYLTADGTRFSQSAATRLRCSAAVIPPLRSLQGDRRAPSRQAYVTSRDLIGDYVLTGGSCRRSW